MNILVIIFIILVIWRLCRGYKNGFAKEVHGLISLFMALIVLSIVFLLTASILQKNTKITVMAVVLLVIAGILCRLINLIMKSVEALAKLPFIGSINKLLGAAAGAAELLIIFWIMYAVVDCFPTGEFGEQIMAWTKESTLLMNVYHKNYIANWIMTISSI